MLYADAHSLVKRTRQQYPNITNIYFRQLYNRLHNRTIATTRAYDQQQSTIDNNVTNIYANKMVNSQKSPGSLQILTSRLNVSYTVQQVSLDDTAKQFYNHKFSHCK